MTGGGFGIKWKDISEKEFARLQQWRSCDILHFWSKSHKAYTNDFTIFIYALWLKDKVVYCSVFCEQHVFDLIFLEIGGNQEKNQYTK